MSHAKAIRYVGAALFDGRRLQDGASLLVRDGHVLAPDGPVGRVVDLGGGFLLPGLLDLQVNGAGGRMIDGATAPDQLDAFCDIHAGLGATGVMPTLITDTPQATQAVIAAGLACRHPGFLGLHLEGPHLDLARKGAHDAALIRPMQEADLALLCRAAVDLPALMVTVAPQSVAPDQIARLVRAGVIVSLGHTGGDHAAAQPAIAAGARAVTHLFNAMAPFGHREPGLPGAALEAGLYCGLIADGLHVHPAALRMAAAAYGDRLFLVTDAMAPAGTDLAEFDVGGRRILRRDGRLTLADGTLAGADLTLPQAIATMVAKAAVAPERAFAMATAHPAALLGRADRGHLHPGAQADFVHLADDFALRGVWRAGQRLV